MSKCKNIGECQRNASAEGKNMVQHYDTNHKEILQDIVALVNQINDKLAKQN